jgi:hypothetical protein
VVQQTEHRQRLTVAWYGGGRRAVEVVSGTAHGYEAGQPLVAVLWVWVPDGTGTHRDEYFFTTAVRRWLWVEWVFAIPGHRTAFSRLSRPFQQLLLAGLAPAA